MNQDFSSVFAALSAGLGTEESRLAIAIVKLSLAKNQTWTPALLRRDFAAAAGLTKAHATENFQQLLAKRVIERREGSRGTDGRQRFEYALRVEWLMDAMVRSSSTDVNLSNSVQMDLLDRDPSLSEGLRQDFLSSSTGCAKVHLTALNPETSGAELCYAAGVAGPRSQAEGPAIIPYPIQDSTENLRSASNLEKGESSRIGNFLGGPIKSGVQEGSEKVPSPGTGISPNGCKLLEIVPESGTEFEPINTGLKLDSSRIGNFLSPSLPVLPLASPSVPLPTPSHWEVHCSLLTALSERGVPGGDSTTRRLENQCMSALAQLVGGKSILEFGGLYRKRLRTNPAKFRRVSNAVALDKKEGKPIDDFGRHWNDLWNRFAD